MPIHCSESSNSVNIQGVNGMNRSVAFMFRSRLRSCFGKSSICLALLVASSMLTLLFVSQQAMEAQVSKGSVSGSVVDAQGASVPDASVKIVNADTNETATVTSDRAGLFRFALLSIGTYRLEVEKAGFNKTVIDKIDVTLGADRGLGSLTLQVGEISTSVEVSSALPLMETTEAQVTNAFST